MQRKVRASWPRVAIDQARLLLLHTTWRLDQPASDPQQLRSDVAAVKLVTAQLQTQVVDHAIQMFGAMGLSPDTPLAFFGPGDLPCT